MHRPRPPAALRHILWAILGAKGVRSAEGLPKRRHQNRHARKMMPPGGRGGRSRRSRSSRQWGDREQDYLRDRRQPRRPHHAHHGDLPGARSDLPPISCADAASAG